METVALIRLPAGFIFFRCLCVTLIYFLFVYLFFYCLPKIIPYF